MCGKKVENKMCLSEQDRILTLMMLENGYRTISYEESAILYNITNPNGNVISKSSWLNRR